MTINLTKLAEQRIANSVHEHERDQKIDVEDRKNLMQRLNALEFKLGTNAEGNYVYAKKLLGEQEAKRFADDAKQVGIEMSFFDRGNDEESTPDKQQRIIIRNDNNIDKALNAGLSLSHLHLEVYKSSQSLNSGRGK